MSAWSAAEGLDEQDLRLLDAAEAVRGRAYAPYSGFFVGAALLLGDGSVVVGCNVENAAYPVTLCAERSAVAAAVAGGSRDLVAIAVVGSGVGPTPPCGMCRQALREHAVDLRILAAGADGQVAVHSIGELLPAAFGPDRLGGPDQLT